MTDLPRVVAESDVGSVAKVEIWRKNKKIIIDVLLGELPEKTYVKNESQKEEDKIQENFIKSLAITVIETKENKGVSVSKTDNEIDHLEIGDIILEVNREKVDSIKTFLLLVNKYEKTGRSSLLLKIQRDDELSWVTIKFIVN